MSAGTDESFARDLLCRYYKELQAKPRAIQLVDDDPPDLLVQWSHEEIWGVEVTRLYDAALPIGNEDRWVSSATVRRTLEQLGQKINEKTRAVRKRSYTLFFQGPSPLNLLDCRANRPPYREWERATIKAICEHITQDKTHPLRGPHYRLTPGEPGNRWLVTVGTGVNEIDLALDAAIQSAAASKLERLPHWTKECSQRWLLLLNCYPLADDTTALDYIGRWLNNSTAKEFHGVFWSGYPDRVVKAVRPST